MPRKFLYPRLGSAVIVILALFAVTAPPGAAQGKPQLKRPQQTEEKLPEEKKPKKNVKGPRAVGLLQLTGSKGTLFPIAILVDGRFYDASVYKADPVPMALESGTVYEAEQAGDSLGLFTINGALHSKAQGSPHPWLGAGSYLPRGTDAPKSTRKAEDVPVGIGSSSASGSDERPLLTRGKSSKPAEASSPAPATGSSTPAGGSSEKPAAQPVSDKPADQSVKPQTPTTPSQQAPGQSSSGQSSPGQSSPGQSAPGTDSQAQASQGQASGEKQSENYYRPTLRRGKPTQAAPQEDEAASAGKPKPDESKTGKPESSAAAGAGAAQLVAAISDGGGPDPRSYKFFWKTGEEEERRNQMLGLAADEVRAYANALAKNRIPATPLAAAKTTAAGRKAAAKPAQPVFENVQFRAFDVWVNNQPVMIWSAEAHVPPAPGATAPAQEQYSITLVARTDIYGNLRKLYSGVTDKSHLDVTPRLELIDAVDADGDGRGELLFRETTDAGSGYVIYRATADKLAKMFDSLGEQ